MGLFSSVVGSIFGKATDYEYGRKLQHDSQDFQSDVLQNRHQWEVEDLEKAGLNPLLSAMGGSSGGASGGIASLGATDNPVTSAAQVKRMHTESNMIKQQTLESKARTEEAQSRTLKNREDVRISSAQAQKEEIDARRKQREFEAIDKDASSEALGRIEALPPALRGPARFGHSTARELMKSVKEWYGIKKDKIEDFFKGRLKNQRNKSNEEKRKSFKPTAKDTAGKERRERLINKAIKNIGKYKYIKTKDGGIRMERK